MKNSGRTTKKAAPAVAAYGGRGFRLSKKAKKEKKRPGKKLEKGVENPFFIYSNHLIDFQLSR
ncbi:hypothetical protein ASJ35_01960 [Ruthenibacterium lactatiformans]|uniref:Uncharacterized protein n=1 Tax=Ruthenibacterium lactatiformans TaxID=1550024 RepID=A0A0W7TUJ4_9FIRM|nr:hypothetical protein ASJ35_01960 [Ruthenibacterium lactatiformans]